MNGRIGIRWALLSLSICGGLWGYGTRAALGQAQPKPQQTFGLFERCEVLDAQAPREEWRDALEPMDTVQQLVESMAPESPLSDRSKLPRLDSHLTNPLATPGSHSLWREAKYVSDRPPDTDSGSYIYGSLAIINGPVVHVLPDGVEPTRRHRPRSQMWSGYIYSAIAVVHGGIKLSGYINDSIVIAAGPIEIDGYISNSIVISLADEDQIPIDVERGYVANSLLVARQAKIGSFRASTLIGKLIGDDLRGGQIVTNTELIPKLVEICRPSADARKSPDARAKKAFTSPDAAQFLRQLLDSEQDAKSAFLADLLAEFQLTDEQVRQLIRAADETTADKRRNSLWHAIRLSKSRIGRQYLLDRLVQDAKQSDEELIVEFLHTLTNPSSYDAQLLIQLYQRAGKDKDGETSGSRDVSRDVERQVVAIVTTPWQDLCADWNRYGRVVFTLDRDESAWTSRRISDQRREQAERGQFQILLWLVKHGRTDEHRISAFQRSLNRGEWVKHGTDVPSRLELVNSLIGSSNHSDFRARIIPLIANFQKPETFLNAEEDARVRLAAIMTLAAEFQQARLSGRYYHRTLALETIAAKTRLDDDSKEVRQAAEQLLSAIRRLKSKE